MSYLLDTNVLSEVVRPRPNQNVLQWFESVPSEVLHISVLSLGEIRKGIEGVKDEDRKEKLRLWLETELPDWFEDRILNIDQPVAERWGRLQYEVKRPMPAIDSLIAATALHHDLRLVTRNEQDFQYPFLQVVNPWE
jgi:toxin FitB